MTVVHRGAIPELVLVTMLLCFQLNAVWSARRKRAFRLKTTEISLGRPTPSRETSRSNRYADVERFSR
jgi:hypothetical protein